MKACNQKKYTINEEGDKEWRVDGKLHREDGPAIKYRNGAESWYKDGILHRKNGPALTYNNDDDKEWYYDGKLHREDGPAVEYNDMRVFYWYLDGVQYVNEKEWKYEMRKRKLETLGI